MAAEEDRIPVMVVGKPIHRMDELADDLQAAGMTVDAILHSLGVVAGSILPSQRPTIEALPMVVYVSDNRPVQLADPDALDRQ